MDKKRIIFGLGETGFAFARYFSSQGMAFEIADSREAPKQLEQFKKDFPNVSVHLGKFNESLYEGNPTFYMSPGLDSNESFFAKARVQGIRLCGDIELFKENAKAPIIAITGTNGKSTVTAWLNHVGELSKKSILMGGNIGIPTLDLLSEPVPDFYVIELSSFQLELSEPLRFYAGCITNISPDHLDRHGTIENYQAIKKRIYHPDSFNVYNLDDERTYPDAAYRDPKYAFSLSASAPFCVAVRDDKFCIVKGEKVLLLTDELSLMGRQNWQNALAVVALADCMGIEEEAIIEGLKTFPGLPHRCQLVRELNGVRWFNDSKGTNVGASVAAIEGIASANSKGRTVILLGGQGKGADFLPLAEVAKQHCALAVVYGEDAPLISRACHQVNMPYAAAADLSQAIKVAYTETKAGDIVLFSPSCASFDMFSNFMARGDYFKDEVLKLK